MKRASQFWLLFCIMVLPAMLDLENMACLAFIGINVAIAFAAFWKYNLHEQDSEKPHSNTNNKTTL